MASQMKVGEVTHGMRKSKVYNVWCLMKQRCLNPNNKSYPNYGGRGIQVCDRWLEFANFYEDMGKPSDGMTLERIDNNGNYDPTNCKWATRKEQSNNQQHTRLIEFNGETYSVSEWARKLGLSQATLNSRLNRYGWSISRALTTPARPKASVYGEEVSDGN